MTVTARGNERQKAVTTTDNERMSMRDLEVLSSIDPITTSTGDSEGVRV